MPRKKIVPVETEAQQAAEAEITTESALEQFRQDNDIRHSPEETAETELEEVLSEEEDEAASELREEAGAEEEIESESILHETAGFLSANGQSQGMTREMLTLFNGAQYAGTILTGRLTGVERIPLGIVATISYNKNDGTLNNLNGVTVKINADKMGLRMDLIRRGIVPSPKKQTKNLREKPNEKNDKYDIKLLYSTAFIPRFA